MKKPLLTYRILFLYISLLPAAAGLLHAQAPCRKFVQVSAAHGDFLGIAEDGTLWAWKWITKEVWEGGRMDRWGGGGEPEQVGTDRDWKQAVAGNGSSLALKTNGTLWAWGGNNNGELGLGHTTDQTAPVQVGTDTDWDRLVSDLANKSQSGSFSMAIKTNGSLWFWGNDTNYQSGLSEEPPYNIPHVQIRLSPIEAGTQARNWKMVSVGHNHIVALKTNGTLWGWGYVPGVGHGATGSVVANTVYNPVVKAPFQLGTATDWKTVAAGGDFNLALKNDGTLWSWGDNVAGQLGNGVMDRDYNPIATQVGTDRDWKMITASWYNSYALKNDGSLWAWGSNSFGEVGDGTRTERAVPTRIGESNDWVRVTGLGDRGGAVAVKSDGSFWMWGDGVLFPTRVEVAIFVPAIGLHGDAATLPATDQWRYFEKDCRLICGVAQTNNQRVGSPEVLNSLTARVWVDGAELFGSIYNDRLRRHYQITPALNAATTTGLVSLYFTQEEFDEFNRVATNLKKLPTGPDDAAGKANLLIEKRSGVSADGSGRPASYPGTAETINPADADIIWDAGNRRWEVKFNVTGFSGFWVKTTSRPLPVTFGSIAARIQGGSLWVDFTSEKETNNHHYEIEASTDGKTFKKIGELCSQAPNGNSDTAISYTFKTAVSGIMGAAGIAGVVLLALVVGAGSRRRRLLPAAIVVISLWGAAACVKHSREPVAHHSPKIWVRIAQVDKDGTKEYSKIVQAVAKD